MAGLASGISSLPEITEDWGVLQLQLLLSKLENVYTAVDRADVPSLSLLQYIFPSHAVLTVFV